MKDLQPKLPLHGLGTLLYECFNPECFFAGSLLGFDDVVWKHYWDSVLESLELRPTCPSCGDPMVHWDDEQ